MTSVFAAVFIALWVGHHIGDHWVQTHRQACGKGAPTREGRMLCLEHVATLTATKAAALLAALWILHVEVSTPALVAGLALDAASHYLVDRRFPLERMAAAIGKTGFYQLGQPRPGTDDAPHLGTGAYALDQSWHIGWLFVAALIIGGA